VYPAVLEELLPAAWHRTNRYANYRVECDHGRLKSRLRPMRGLKQDRSARVVITGHALVQNVRRGHTNWRLRSQWAGGCGRVRRAGPGGLIQDRGRRFNLPRSAQRNRAIGRPSRLRAGCQFRLTLP